MNTMVRKIEDEQEALTFLTDFRERGIGIPMLQTPEQLRSNLLRCVSDPRDLVLGVYDGDLLVSMFSFMVEPQERYLELLAALTDNREDFVKILRFLEEVYAGFTLDCVFHPEHQAVASALRDFGAKFYPIQVKMRHERMVPYCHHHQIVPFASEYRAGYTSIHERDCYWTAEAVLAAPEIFRVFLVLRGEAVVGYVDYTHKHEENEVYDLFVREDCRRQGIGKALLDAALRDNAPKGMTLMVDEDNGSALGMYERMGFRQLKGERSVTATMTVRTSDNCGG